MPLTVLCLCGFDNRFVNKCKISPPMEGWWDSWKMEWEALLGKGLAEVLGHGDGKKNHPLRKR